MSDLPWSVVTPWEPEEPRLGYFSPASAPRSSSPTLSEAMSEDSLFTSVRLAQDEFKRDLEIEAAASGSSSSSSSSPISPPPFSAATNGYRCCTQCGGSGIIRTPASWVLSPFMPSPPMTPRSPAMMRPPSAMVRSPTIVRSPRVAFTFGAATAAAFSSTTGVAVSRDSKTAGSYIPRECKFCRKNGEAFATYSSHTLRCPSSQRLICPVLRSHVCNHCEATGDEAHTSNYCPKLVKEKKNMALQDQLCHTRRNASGFRPDSF